MENNSTNTHKTDPSVMAKTIGRDASETIVRNPPQFEVQPVNMYSKGIKWFSSLMKIETNPYNYSK